MKKGETPIESLQGAQLVEKSLTSGWVHLNNILSHLSRKQVATLLWHEVNNGRRDQFVKRLHQRLARIRTNDELKQLRKARDPDAIDWLKQEVAHSDIS